ncbi:MAG: hypothetical protein HYZ26_02280 [Chloroflexi bacterium]|nr:hypothetical protein [Chloroflexota bacterium]
MGNGLLFFLKGVYAQAEDASQRISRLQELRTEYHRLVAIDRNASKLKRVIDYLIGTPITSIGQAQTELQIGSYTTIQRYFGRLEEFGILRESTGQRRNRLYRADGILRILDG